MLFVVHRSSLCGSIRFHAVFRSKKNAFLDLNCVGNVTHMRRAPVLPALARSAAAARVTFHRQARACDMSSRNPTSGTTEWPRGGHRGVERAAATRIRDATGAPLSLNWLLNDSIVFVSLGRPGFAQPRAKFPLRSPVDSRA